LTLDCRGAEADNNESIGKENHAKSLRYYTPIGGKATVDVLLALSTQKDKDFEQEYTRHGADFGYWEKWHETWAKNHYPYNLVDTIYVDPVKIFIVNGLVDGNSFWHTPNTIKSATPGHIDFVEYDKNGYPHGNRGTVDREGSIDRSTGLAWFAAYYSDNNKFAEPPVQTYMVVNAKPAMF
jgi:hypothetical protein